MVHFNKGPTRWDATGLGRVCLPFIPVRSNPTTAERFYTAGNERTPFDYNPGGTSLSSGSGYHLFPQDKFSFLVELMNMHMQDQLVYVTMLYDYLDQALPAGWSDVKGVWLDANQCGTSEVRPRSETGAYTIESKPWAPNFEGKVLSAMGHVHDGGIAIDIRATVDKSLCTATSRYSETPEYKYSGTSMGGDKVAVDHISSMPGCTSQEIKVRELRRGQAWTVKGEYDYAKRDGNLENGRQAEVRTSSTHL